MFSVGDEVVCIDDSPYGIGAPFSVRKGERFTVIGAFPVGTPLAPNGESIRDVDAISIGLENPAMVNWYSDCNLFTYDLWPAFRFRKVERKRTREELYALIGIALGQNGNVRVLETVDA